MRPAWNISREVVILALLFNGAPTIVATADAGFSEAAVLFLLINNSPRANAMGGCSINLVDEQAALYNPGAVGLHHLEKVFSVSTPNNTQWLPGLADDLYLKTSSVSAGMSRRLLFSDDAKYDVSLGIAYARKRIELGQQTRVDEFGNILGSFDTYETADLFTMGAGLQYYLRLGVGLTYKRIASHLAAQGAGAEQGSGTAEGSAFDFGVLVELPLLDFIPHHIYLDQHQKYPLTFQFTPSMAYVYANSGDDISYIDAAQADPLPKVARKGLSLYGAAKIKRAVLVSGRITWQEDQSRVGTPETTSGRGTEIGLFNVVFLRRGRFEDVAGDVFLDTKGYGFSLGGLLSWLSVVVDSDAQNVYLRYLLQHADLTYDHAEYTPDVPGSPLEGTEFVKLSFSF